MYLDLRILWQNLLEKRIFIIGCGLLTLSLAMAYSLVKPTQYQATVLLQVHHKQESSLGSINDSNQPSATDSLAQEPVSVQIALIRSKFILSPVIQALGLDIKVTPEKKHFFNLFPPLKNALQISELQVPAKYLNKRLILLIDRPNHFRLYGPRKKFLLEAEAGQGLASADLFSIKVDKAIAEPGSRFSLIKLPESKQINQIRSRLLITDLSGSSEGSSDKVSILQLMLTGINPEEVIQIINKIALVTQQKDTERKSLEAKKTLEFLYQQLPIILASLKEAEAKLNLYRSNSGKIDIKLQTQYLFTHLSDIDKQLGSIRLKKMDMSQQFTSHHPFIISLNQKYKELEKQRKVILNQIKKLPATDQVATNLARDVTVKNNLYLHLLSKIHEQQVITAGIVSDIGILSLATFPDIPLPLKLSIVGFASLFIGLLLGCLGVAVWQMFNQPLPTPPTTSLVILQPHRH